MLEVVALGVALIAAYCTWRGLVVMNATMRLATFARDQDALSGAAAELHALGSGLIVLGTIYESAEKEEEPLREDPTLAAHWMSSRQHAVEELNRRDVAARGALVTAPISVADRRRHLALISGIVGPVQALDEAADRRGWTGLAPEIASCRDKGKELVDAANELSDQALSMRGDIDDQSARGRSFHRP